MEVSQVGDVIIVLPCQIAESLAYVPQTIDAAGPVEIYPVMRSVIIAVVPFADIRHDELAVDYIIPVGLPFLACGIVLRGETADVVKSLKQGGVHTL